MCNARIHEQEWLHARERATKLNAIGQPVALALIEFDGVRNETKATPREKQRRDLDERNL